MSIANTIEIGTQNGRYVGTYCGTAANKALFRFGTDRIAAWLNGANDPTFDHFVTDYAIEVKKGGTFASCN